MTVYSDPAPAYITPACNSAGNRKSAPFKPKLLGSPQLKSCKPGLVGELDLVGAWEGVKDGKLDMDGDSEGAN
eukprot:CAMPEP_0172299402 /NCGR_PEP_ID=MMETSP1058-20130122/1730_1 /TAXON_ID=83371 /ORGANISM="Detonula confervacea, Strain CCMP 353" /LENGTH=72 /DNA_ID=CAMNT_0013008849 /DNA_START=178 /DNA_END=399 /DNA_ORIENTATION=+